MIKYGFKDGKSRFAFELTVHEGFVLLSRFSYFRTPRLLLGMAQSGTAAQEEAAGQEDDASQLMSPVFNHVQG